MKVAVDAMGGDNGPRVLIEGAVAAAREKGIEITLVGREDLIRKHLERIGATGLPIDIYPASQVVEMKESPADSLRRKKDSTIRVAFELAARGEAQAVVSAGNSGATLATAMVTLDRINSVRPAIATMMPTLKDPVVMIDVGANVDCKPHHLLQFGIMGAVFASKVAKTRTRPRVGLMSIGEEGSKGNLQVRRAYDLLSASGLNFVGNVEGRDVFKGEVDVVVCDGFVGNICLKLSEGFAEAALIMLRAEMKRSFMAKIGYRLAWNAFQRFKKRVDYSEYGGAPLLGIKGVAIICHGRSGVKAVKNAVCMAHELAMADLSGQIAEAIGRDPIRLSSAVT
ncbi:MAG: phosphate acyltransferase PlsX [Dissulfurimicrobium sp.]|uniref:phosphate acyltransferase PlsX n=1 Tax=Dissulfurimicrobium TaxID=1769732 RepID=UPI001EDC0B3E|nr:phosphate acyltransferase PlsX [Dissulfurimicrobium hydrothermale]UKL14561.1 phosphate acyltransferase PlsX [Dissulfurimicrobium hydrothermale]